MLRVVPGSPPQRWRLASPGGALSMQRRYIARLLARRLATALLLLILISFGTFALLALSPGSPIDVLLAGKRRTPEIVQSLEETYHLTGSFLDRYTSWAWGAIHFDFGQSIAGHQPVIDQILHRAPITLELAGIAFVLVLALGIPLGALSAVWRGRSGDRAIVAGTVVGVSTPPFVTGILLIYLFAVTLRLLPSFGPGGGQADRVEHLILPALALAFTALAIVVKVTRTAMIRELEQDYVVFARARGHSTMTVLVRYALRNALIPVVTASGLVLGYMVGGAVLVEQVFSLPGLGSLLVQSAEGRDLPTLQGVVIVISIVIIVLNLLTDLLYLAIDPRVRFGESVE
jgi:peptide/nickel transport system permease protein